MLIVGAAGIVTPCLALLADSAGRIGASFLLVVIVVAFMLASPKPRWLVWFLALQVMVVFGVLCHVASDDCRKHIN